MRHKKDRYDPGYEECCKEVLLRDGHSCQMPGCTRTKKLEVHHIQRYSDNPYLRTDPRNLITLCAAHHWEVRGKEKYYANMFQTITDSKYT